MIKIQKIAPRLFILAGFVIAASASAAHAESCKRVDFTVQNDKNVSIATWSIGYLFEHDGVWRTEEFPATSVDANEFDTVAIDQNLTGGEGNRLIGLKLYFRAWCGGKWSVPLVSQEDVVFDDDSPCKSNSGRSYRIDLGSSDVCD